LSGQPEVLSSSIERLIGIRNTTEASKELEKRKDMEVMMMMSQTRPLSTVSIPIPSLANAISQRNFKNPKTLKLRASISNPNFPLASRIMVTSKSLL
jgi:hypothetical protein